MLDTPDTVTSSNGSNDRKAHRPMSRTRFQRGSIVIEPRSGGPWYIGRLHTYVWVGGKEKRREKRFPLGPVEKIGTISAARHLFQPEVDKVNAQARTGYLREEITFEQLCHKWEQVMLQQYEKSTQQTHPSTLKPARQFFSRMKLQQITGEDVQRFIAEQQRQKYAPKTIINRVRTMQTVWNVARQWKYVDHDPFFKVKLPKRPKGGQRFFTELEARAIIEASEPAESLFWEMDWQGGPRFGELSVAAVDAFKFITVEDPHTHVVYELAKFHVLRTRWHQHVRELAGKSENAVRSFTFSPELTKKIRRYIAAMPEGQRWLFCTRNGKPWHYTWVRRRLLATCDRLGIEGAQTKAFRHGSASYMFSQNVPGPVITSRLGHHSADFTEKVYAKALMQDEIALALRMDKPVIQ